VFGIPAETREDAMTAMIYTTELATYEWHGGEYVEITPKGENIPVDVINVWDYEKGEPLIPRTFASLIRRVTRYEKENGY
jgi:hypothetical protein